MQSALFKSLESHSELLRTLLVLHKDQGKRLNVLEDILSSLRSGYNPNYQDMAVLEAVRGWEQVAGLSHINDVRKDEVGEETQPFDIQDGVSGEVIDQQIEDILKTNYISLLMEHDQFLEISQMPSSSALLSLLCFSRLTTYRPGPNLASHISNFLNPALDYIRSLASAVFGRTPSIDVADVSRLRQSLSDAEASLREAEEKLRNTEQELGDLFKPDRFGSDGVWKKVDRLCLEKDTGEYVLLTSFDTGCSPLPRYTYEVCLFGEARQKANSGGSSHSLGHFSSWKRDEEIGTLDYYSRQVFTGGAKCWNGPQRSVQVCRLNLSVDRLVHPPFRLHCHVG